MKKIINYGKQFIDVTDINEVIKVLKSQNITQGPYVDKFEIAFAKKLHCKYAVAVSSGTAALHLIGISLGWTQNDIVICSPNTFIATAASVEYCGASLEFADIDSETFNICPLNLEKKIKELKKKGKKIKAVIVTDYAGQPADWHEIYKLKNKYKFQIVNDNCHSFGSIYKNKINYATLYADAVSLSFHPVKHITTAEGGMILTNNKKIFQKTSIIRSHGMIRNNKYYNGYYEMSDLGYNYRLNEISCALGLSQLKKLKKFINYRKLIAKYYFKLLNNSDLISLPKTKSNRDHSYHLFVIRIDFRKLKITKKELINFFLKKGFKLQVHYIPLHTQKYFKKKYNYKNGRLLNCEEFYNQAISLPIYYNLKKNIVVKFCDLLKKYIASNIKN